LLLPPRSNLKELTSQKPQSGAEYQHDDHERSH
jgi:hypothetical protein